MGFGAGVGLQVGIQAGEDVAALAGLGIDQSGEEFVELEQVGLHMADALARSLHVTRGKNRQEGRADDEEEAYGKGNDHGGAGKQQGA